MKKVILGFVLAMSCVLSVSVAADAWVHSPNMEIKNIIQWDSNAPIYFTLSNETVCYIPAVEKNMYSLILSLYTAKKKAEFHCHVGVDSYGGYNGHRIHRVIAN